MEAGEIKFMKNNMTNIYKLSDSTGSKVTIKMYSLLHSDKFSLIIIKTYNINLL